MPPMNQTAYLVTTTRSAYGTQTASGETALRCRFRYITQVNLNNIETTDADAMAWFEPDSGVDLHSIIKFDGTHWRVERVTKPVDFETPNVHFIKVDLIKYGVIS